MYKGLADMTRKVDNLASGLRTPKIMSARNTRCLQEFQRPQANLQTACIRNNKFGHPRNRLANVATYNVCFTRHLIDDRQNNRAVMEAYGFPVKNEFTESLCVAELFKMYQARTAR